MNKILYPYYSNAGLCFSIALCFIFATTNLIAFSIGLFSFLLSLLSVWSQNTKISGKFFDFLRIKNNPLLYTGVALFVQSIISFSSGFVPQAIIGMGYAFGNTIKFFELESEKSGKEFLGFSRIIRTILRPELMISIANIALAYLSASEALYLTPLLLIALFISFLPEWKGQLINYAWSRLILTIFYCGLSFFALLNGNWFLVFGNLFTALGSLNLVIQMNSNYRILTNAPRGFSLLKTI